MEKGVGQKAPPKSLALVAAFLTATSSIFIRSSAMPSLMISLYRMVISTLMMGVILLATRERELHKIKAKDWGLCAASGIALALHFATWIASVSMTTVTASTVLVASSPVFVAVITAVLTRTRPARVLMLCIGASLAGTVLIAADGAGGGKASLAGNLLALAGAFFVAIYLVIGSHVRKRVPTNTYAFVVYGFSALVLLMLGAATGADLGPYAPREIGIVAAMALCCSVGGHTTYNRLLEHHGAVLISLSSLCEPVFATLLALVILGEAPGPVTLLGSVVILASTAWYFRKTGTAE